MSEQEINEVVEEPLVEPEVTQETEEEIEQEISLEEQLEAAKAEAEDYKDRWVRVNADFENARKRMAKQRSQSYQNATADLAEKILPVIDDFGRALENVPESIASDSWFEGIELVQRKLENILVSFEVKPIKAVGEQFDPNLHEAITAQPSEEHESGTVLKELQKGYMIGERVIRPSLVIVAQ